MALFKQHLGLLITTETPPAERAHATRTSFQTNFLEDVFGRETKKTKTPRLEPDLVKNEVFINIDYHTYAFQLSFYKKF